MGAAAEPSRGRFVERTWRPTQDHGGGRRHRRPQRIEAFVPDSIADWDPQLTGGIAATIAAADLAIQELNRHAPHVAGLEALARQLLRQESVGSSRIEGLRMGQRRLARAASGIGADDTARQIVGNVRAMEQAMALAAEPRRLTVQDVVAIHRTLLESTRDAHFAGAIRDEQNWIGGSDLSPANAEFIPPPPEEVHDLLADLVAFLDRDDLPPTLQAAIAHAQFETIHPFADGNGRVGRCLIHVVYRRRGLAPSMVPPVSLMLATRGDRYVGGLSAFRFHDPADWAEFFAATVSASVHQAESLAERLQALRRDWLSELGDPRADASIRTLVDRLPAEPVVDVARAMEIAGVSRPAAARAIDGLVEAGILSPLDRRERNRHWEAPDVFALLDDFERDLTR
jgi:Fic family protein